MILRIKEPAYKKRFEQVKDIIILDSTGRDTLTIEELYQLFKARIEEEHTNETQNYAELHRPTESIPS